MRIYVKGATEVILERCNRILTSKGFISNGKYFYYKKFFNKFNKIKIILRFTVFFLSKLFWFILKIFIDYLKKEQIKINVI